MHKYKEVKSIYNPVETEIEILDFWKKNDVFNKSVNKNKEEFVFFDGPPFANGMPHYGHLLTGFVKDTVARYQTMCGKKVERRFGWDCHGLPAEMSAEKEIGISGRLDIQKYGIEKFNEHCKKSAMTYASEWRAYIDRQCRWVDFDNSYKTMDRNFMESVFWVFKQLYDKGLVYESVRVMPYSWKCETPLSNFETRMDNSYREKTSKSVIALFNLKETPKKLAGIKCKILVWTTTPWTLPSNLALAVGKDINYKCFVGEDNNGFICSESYSKKLVSDKKIQFSSVVDISSSELTGLNYEPLFDFFANTQNAFTILKADFVQDGEGTGVVHIAPGFGEDDFQLCSEHGIDVVCPVDDSGKFTSDVGEFAGMHVFNANDNVISHLKRTGNWYETSQYIHNYPHCWRTDTPLIYKAMPSWYVAVTKIKDRMVELNEKINWVPESVKYGQFDGWLKGARDWSISRNRFWGTPIPIWKSTDPAYPRIDVYGSIAEIEKDFNTKIVDLHLPFIDSLTRKNPNDPTGRSIMRRVQGVFDCWFESGSMPYAQTHYPFNNQPLQLPADFVSEYIAQTRGWFYTMFVLSTALFDEIPFKNCVCHGVVLDETGRKLSKRLNNYQDPMDVFNKYGSDALRFLMLSNTVISGGTLLLDKDGVMISNILKTIINQIWNGYYFFTMYANIDGIKSHLISESTNDMDKYILAKCNASVSDIKSAMEEYNTFNACAEVTKFFDVLNNWYIRSNKQRFWKNKVDTDKMQAYNTLYTVFHKMCRAFAPLMPVISEKIWLGMGYEGLSVHLADFPVPEIIDDPMCIQLMDLIIEASAAVLSLRNTHKIRVRQPLECIKIYHPEALSISEYYIGIIKSEVNVKNIFLSSETTEVAKKRIKLNFNAISKHLAKQIPTIMSAVKFDKWRILSNGDLFIENTDITLTSEEYEVLLETNSDLCAAFDNNKGIIELDITLTNNLLSEGHARDLIRYIQQARKSLGFNVSDKISVKIQTVEDEIIQAFNDWKINIMEQVLANDCSVIASEKDIPHNDYSAIQCKKLGLLLHIKKS